MDDTWLGKKDNRKVLFRVYIGFRGYNDIFIAAAQNYTPASSFPAEHLTW